jgi:tetratricopeptide (TPR) repeat protein
VSDVTDRCRGVVFDSVSVLDDLALMVAPLAERLLPDVDVAVLEPLLGRAMALIRSALAGHEESRLECVHLRNRPVLRLMTQEALRLDRVGREEEAAALFAWMLRLNPNDNQGHREWLINHHLRDGGDARALEVAAPYADNFLVPTIFGQALALWRLGRRDEAEAALRAAAAHRPLGERARLADRLEPPEASPYGVAVAVRKRPGSTATPCATCGLRRRACSSSCVRFPRGRPAGGAVVRAGASARSGTSAPRRASGRS